MTAKREIKEYKEKDVIFIAADMFNKMKTIYPHMDVIQLAAFMTYGATYILSVSVKDPTLRQVAKGCQDILTNPYHKEKDEIPITEEGESTSAVDNADQRSVTIKPT